MTMQLWLLKPRDDRPGAHLRATDPWEPWFDKAFGFVVRAADEAAARQLATGEAGVEGRDRRTPWLDPMMSTCVPLLPEGDAGVVLRDFAAA